MQRSLDLLALTKRLEMISTKPAVGRHFFFEDLNSKARKGGGARPFIPELLV